MRNKLITLSSILVCVLVLGCEKDAPEKPTPPARTVLYQAPATTQPGNPDDVVKVVLVHGDPSVHSSYEITPDVAKGDKFFGWRMLSWAGASPNSVARDYALRKGSDKQEPLPAVSLDKDGIRAEKGAGTSSKQEGASWITLLWNNIWDFVTGITTGLFWIAIGGVAILFVAPLIFPAFAPIAKSIIAGLGRAVAWIIPIFGGIFEWLRGRKKTQSAQATADVQKHNFVTTVHGVENWKTALFKRSDITDVQRQSIWDEFKACVMAKQDADTQVEAKTISNLPA